MEQHSEGQSTPQGTDAETKRRAEEQRLQETYRKMMASKFSPEDEEILDELGI
jgi:hypothetical protein